VERQRYPLVFGYTGESVYDVCPATDDIAAAANKNRRNAQGWLEGKMRQVREVDAERLGG
jgi:hypothetical protein